MELENNLSHPRPFRSITDEELNTFTGVFIPGGHAPLTDLGDDPELGRILLHFHTKVKPTGSYCVTFPPTVSDISHSGDLSWSLCSLIDQVRAWVDGLCVRGVQDHGVVRRGGETHGDAQGRRDSEGPELAS
jgi:hypothetical protein